MNLEPPLLGIYPREMKTYIHKRPCVYKPVLLCTSPSLGEKTHMFIRGRLDRPIVVYLYSGLLLSSESGWLTDAFNNIEGSQKHYAEWRKSDTKEYILIHLYEILLKCKANNCEKNQLTGSLGWRWFDFRESWGTF